MADAATKMKPETTASEAERELTDGFHLVIDALTLNGVTTIYGVPGIPITDFGRLAQAAGLRVISFRHEQHAGNAAAIAGFLTKKPGICLTVSAPGFLNGLTALANATTNCFPMILISGSSEREIIDLQQGDYEEMDQLAIAKPLCKAAFRVLHAADIGIGVARAIRAAVSGRPSGDGRGGWSPVTGQGHRPGAGPASRSLRCRACARSPEGCQAPPDYSRQRRGIRAGR
jgi:oxalyl-CoA decarboxylase